MDDNREDEELVWVTLNAATAAHLARRAQAAGRTLEKQILYELKIVHGGAVPDPGDVEATQHGQLFRRMFQGRILQSWHGGSLHNPPRKDGHHAERTVLLASVLSMTATGSASARMPAERRPRPNYRRCDRCGRRPFWCA